ncbi:hypothetical protein D3C85_868290 [compost metagenome]
MQRALLATKHRFCLRLVAEKGEAGGVHLDNSDALVLRTALPRCFEDGAGPQIDDGFASHLDRTNPWRLSLRLACDQPGTCAGGQGKKRAQCKESIHGLLRVASVGNPAYCAIRQTRSTGEITVLTGHRPPASLHSSRPRTFALDHRTDSQVQKSSLSLLLCRLSASAVRRQPFCVHRIIASQ